MRAKLGFGLILVIAAGCATVYKGQYDWKEGWRKGRIDAIGNLADLPSLPIGCTASPGSPDQRLFASVAYVHMRTVEHRTVEVPDSSFGIGDPVFFNVSGCVASRHHLEDGSPLL